MQGYRMPQTTSACSEGNATSSIQESEGIQKKPEGKPTVLLRTPTQMTQVLMSGMNGTTCLQSNGGDTSTNSIVRDKKKRAGSPCPMLTGRYRIASGSWRIGGLQSRRNSAPVQV